MIILDLLIRRGGIFVSYSSRTNTLVKCICCAEINVQYILQELPRKMVALKVVSQHVALDILTEKVESCGFADLIILKEAKEGVTSQLASEGVFIAIIAKGIVLTRSPEGPSLLRRVCVGR